MGDGPSWQRPGPVHHLRVLHRLDELRAATRATGQHLRLVIAREAAQVADGADPRPERVSVAHSAHEAAAAAHDAYRASHDGRVEQTVHDAIGRRRAAVLPQMDEPTGDDDPGESGVDSPHGGLDRVDIPGSSAGPPGPASVAASPHVTNGPPALRVGVAA